MGQPRLDADRVWFYDTRTPGRRMGVSTHADAGVVIISLWNAEVCTGTFRLPISDAARVIAVLADGLAAAVPPTTASVTVAASPNSWVERLARRLGLHREPPGSLRRVK